jgi:iron(III) transport system permease protein
MDRWTLAAILIALALSAPVLIVLAHLATPRFEVWGHLARTALGGYVTTSITLLVGVCFGAAVIGVATAWLVSMCRFPGRRIFEWALLTPMAAPAYVLAYTYAGLLDVAGPVQSFLRATTGLSVRELWFPEIRSLGGAIAMLTLVLYPYVYLLVRTAFLSQSVCALEVARTLGHGPWRSFWRVALPLARPALAAGVALVGMETLNDFGAIQHFAVDAFTTGIYRAWFGLGDPMAAAQLGGLMMLFILCLLLLERGSRGNARYHHTSPRHRALPRFKLSPGAAILAMLTCLLPILLGFLLPCGVMLYWAIETAPEVIDQRFWGFAGNSLMLSAGTAAIAMTLALILAYGLRLSRSPLLRSAVRVAVLGYAAPGAVVAIGLLLAFGWVDRAIDWILAPFGGASGLIISGSIAALIYAYVVRFLAVSLNAAESGLAKVTPALDGAARTLGEGYLGVLRRIHAPMLRGSLLAGGLLVFVDTMKELPATMILRPFNFDTLAVRSFQFARDELLREAATPGLAIVLTGILPVILLARAMDRSRPGHSRS